MLLSTVVLCAVSLAGEPVWIAPPSAPGSDVTPPRLRRTLTLDAVPSAAKVRVIGLGHYELRCNGTEVGDGVINQPWSQYDKTLFWQEFDLAPLLRRGENVLAVTLGDSFWRVGPVNDPGRFSKTDATPDFSQGQPYLLWMDGSATVGTQTVPIVSDTNWVVGPSPLRFSHIYAGEDFDARLDTPGWDSPGFEAGSAWVRAVEAKTPRGERVGLSSPNIKTFEVFEPKEIKRLDGRTSTYVFPQNCSSLLRISVEGKAGQRVRFRPCEYMQPDGRVKFTYTWGTGKDIWHDYTLSGIGVEKHQTVFCYVGAQFVQVEGAVVPGDPNPEGLPVLRSLELVHTRAACPEVGEFVSDSGLQNGAHRLIDWSIRSNMSWVPTDCPHREKNGWLEQNWHMARSMSYRYDIRAWLTKSSRDMLDAQRRTGEGPASDDGFVPTNAPWYLVGRPLHDTYNDAPEWGVASVLVPWHVYEWYGDRGPLVTNYEGMKRYVDYLSRTAKDGVITSNLGDWYDYGHGKGDGPSQWTPAEVSATAIWALGTKTVAETARVLGKKEDEAAYRSRYDAIRATFIAKFYDPATHRVKNGGSCQGGNAAALCVGLVPEADRGAVVAEILADLRAREYQQTTGEVLHVFLVRALAEQEPGWGGREGADALHRVYARESRGSYGFMVKSGLTTLPESWDAKPGTGNSLSHLMLGHLMEWHYAYVVGVRREPGAVGWTRFVFAPQVPPRDLGGNDTMRKARAKFRTPAGEVNAGWEIVSDGGTKPGTEVVRLWCEVPAGTSAVARLPDGSVRELNAGRHEFSCTR